MCLSCLAQCEYDGPTIGYKVVNKVYHNKTNVYTPADVKHPTLPVGDWIEDNNIGEMGNDYVSYPFGFHILSSLEEAQDYRINDPTEVVVKVEFENVVAHGMLDFGNSLDKNHVYYVIVARRIRILEEMPTPPSIIFS